MADTNPYDQAQEQTQAPTPDQAQDAEQTAQGKSGMDGLKDKLDRNRDGKTDAEDVKSMAKEAGDKVKGLMNKR